MVTEQKFREGDKAIYQNQQVKIAGYGVNHTGLKCGSSTPDEIVVIEFAPFVDPNHRREVCEDELELDELELVKR